MVSSYSRAGTARKTQSKKTKTKNTSSNARKKPPPPSIRPAPGRLRSLASSRNEASRKPLEKKNAPQQQQQQQPRRFMMFPPSLPSVRGRKSQNYSSQPSTSVSIQEEHTGFDVEMSQLTEYSHESNHSTSNSLVPELHQSSANSSRSSGNNSIHSGQSLFEIAVGGSQSRGGTVPAAPSRRSWMMGTNGGSASSVATHKTLSGGNSSGVLGVSSVKRSILSDKTPMVLDRTGSANNGTNILEVPQDGNATTTTEEQHGNQESPLQKDNSKITDHFRPKRQAAVDSPNTAFQKREERLQKKQDELETFAEKLLNEKKEFQEIALQSKRSFSDHVEQETRGFSSRVKQETCEWSERVEQDTRALSKHAQQETREFSSRVEQETRAFDAHVQQETRTFDTHVQQETLEFNDNVQQEMTGALARLNTATIESMDKISRGMESFQQLLLKAKESLKSKYLKPMAEKLLPSSLCSSQSDTTQHQESSVLTSQESGVESKLSSTFGSTSQGSSVPSTIHTTSTTSRASSTSTRKNSTAKASATANTQKRALAKPATAAIPTRVSKRLKTTKASDSTSPKRNGTSAANNKAYCVTPSTRSGSREAVPLSIAVSRRTNTKKRLTTTTTATARGSKKARKTSALPKATVSDSQESSSSDETNTKFVTPMVREMMRGRTTKPKRAFGKNARLRAQAVATSLVDDFGFMSSQESNFSSY